MKRVLCILFFLSECLWAYIPNVQAILKEVFEGRKSTAAVVTLQHRIFNPSGDPIEISEEILHQGGGKYFFVWRSGAQMVSSDFSERRYKVLGGVSARSQLFLKYFFAASPEEFRDQALREQFIKRSQLQEFEQDFKAEGDPQTWGLKEKYIKHPEVAFSRLKQGVGVAFSGDESGGEKRRIYFDPTYRGIRRLEWKEGKEVHGWNFESFSRMGNLGYFPKSLSYESNGAETILSSVSGVRPAKEKTAIEFRNILKRPPQSISGDFENALRLLLSYR